MKKIFKLFSVAFLFGAFVLVPKLVFAYSVPPMTGTGVEGDPFMVTDCDQLQLIGTSEGYIVEGLYFKVANTFSCTGKDFVSIGDSSNPFSGIFDGDNKEISDLSIDGSEYMIGLFGKNDGVIENVILTNVNVFGDGDDTVGALVGMNWGTIENSSSTGIVSGSHHVGGLVGYNTSEGSIINSHSSTSVSGTDDYIGGLAGKNNGVITNSYAAGTVTGLVDYSYVGGLTGYSQNTISSSYATGTVTGGYYVGGFVGYNDTNISSSHSTGNVIGLNNYVGGFVGYNDYSSIENSYATGDVSADGDFVGGLVGTNSDGSSISDSYAIGNVNGVQSVGGLVGVNTSGSNIGNSYAIGNVTGSGKWVGGLVGGNTANSSIINGYAKGSVSGDNGVGGLVGVNTGTVTTSYATGFITSVGDNLGGLVGLNSTGRNTGTVNYSYYDSETTGQTDEGKGDPKTTTQMKNQATFQPGDGDWDFEVDGDWIMNSDLVRNDGYPYLQWETFPGTPIATPDAGRYTRNQTIELTSEESTTIYYSTTETPVDCSGDSGTLYTEPISVSETSTIYVRACNVARNPAVASFEYVINKHTSSGSRSSGSSGPVIVQIIPVTAPVVPMNTPLDCKAGDLFSTTTGKSCGTSTAPIAPSTTSEIQKVTQDLKLGMANTDVKTLQLFLIAQNKGVAAQALVLVGSTGYFGNITRLALAEWQTVNGIVPASGYFGPKTRAFIKEKGL